MLAEASFQAIERPVDRDGRRISGLRFADPKVHNLWHALLLSRLLAGGFRSANLRQNLPNSQADRVNSSYAAQSPIRSDGCDRTA